MRKRIDGHVHISPHHRDGWRDPLTGMVNHAHGILEDAQGHIRRKLPAYFADSSFPVESLIAVMDENGIEKAVVMAHLESEIGETAYDALCKFPDRLQTAVSVEANESGLEALKRWNDKGIHILKCEMRSLNEFYGKMDVDAPQMMALYKEAEKRNMILVVDPSPSTFPSYQPEGLAHVLDLCPNLKLVICHMGFPYKGMRNDATIYGKWKKMTDLAKRDNVWFDVTAIPDLFAEENFPWTSAMEFLNEFVSKYGADKVIWGTDIPGTFKNATYTQMIKAFEDCTFLTEENKDKLFYQNANELYFA